MAGDSDRNHMYHELDISDRDAALEHQHVRLGALSNKFLLPPPPSLLSIGTSEKRDTLMPRMPNLSGWRMGSQLALSAAVVTLLVNLAVTIWAHTISSSRNRGSIVEIFHGSCSRAAFLNKFTHLLVNIASTLLVGGSNYCMQTLVAPTREDIDRAHAESRWLDIGIPSLRNLRHVDRRRKILWTILLVSSLPLHFTFNSVFFNSIAANDYTVVFGTTEYKFGSEAPKAIPLTTPMAKERKLWLDVLDAQSHINATEIMRLDNAACIRAYQQDFVSANRNLIVIVQNTTNTTGSVVDFANGETAFEPQPGTPWLDSYNDNHWICNEDWIGVEEREGRSGDWCLQFESLKPLAWRPSGFTPSHCLSETPPEQCSFNFNIAIAWVVVVCNLVKAVAMALIAFHKIPKQPLCTVGDAVESFVKETDTTTRGMCTASWTQISKHTRSQKSYRALPIPARSAPQPWRTGQRQALG